MTTINLLATGFTPFDDRDINASWIAAGAMAGPGCRTLEIPVVWGEPGRHLGEAIKTDMPVIILSLGEGRPGWFDLEHVARNVRGDKPDNHGQSAGRDELIEPDGPDKRALNFDARPLQRALARLGYPVRRSRDAGQYLCEETLYTLLQLQEKNPAIRMALFCHLPPWGSSVNVRGQPMTVDSALMTAFAADLKQACIELNDINQ